MNNIFKYSRYTFISFIFIIFFIPTFFIPVLYSNYENTDSNIIQAPVNLNGEYVWAIPGYTKITSPYGKRTSPTAGASSFHKGIDIGAPEGTNLYAVTNRENYLFRFFRSEEVIP